MSSPGLPPPDARAFCARHGYVPDKPRMSSQVVNTLVVFLCSDCTPFEGGLPIVRCKHAFSRAEAESSSKAGELGFACRRRQGTDTLSLSLSRSANRSKLTAPQYRRHTMAASDYCSAARVRPSPGSDFCHSRPLPLPPPRLPLDTLVLLGSGRCQWSGNDRPSVLDSCDTIALSDDGDGELMRQAGDLAQILTDGSFFYSRNVDYSLRLSRQKAQTAQLKQVAFQPLARDGSQPAEAAARLSMAGRYLWNSFMLEPFFTLGETLVGSERTILYEDFLLPLVRGFFGVKQVRLGSATVELRLISRRDWHREGTRFAKRGIDADGNVAAFAEVGTNLLVYVHGQN